MPADRCPGNQRVLSLSLVQLSPVRNYLGPGLVERMFSLMNGILSDLRSWMRIDRINDIMAVNRLAPGLDTLALEELEEWISFWDSRCKTRR